MGAYAWGRRDGRAEGPRRSCGRATMERRRREGRAAGSETLAWHAVRVFLCKFRALFDKVYRLESADEDEREQEAQSVFVVYSLRTHQIAKMRPLHGFASTFIANENFIIIVRTNFSYSEVTLTVSR